MRMCRRHQIEKSLYNFHHTHLFQFDLSILTEEQSLLSWREREICNISSSDMASCMMIEVLLMSDHSPGFHLQLNVRVEEEQVKKLLIVALYCNISEINPREVIYQLEVRKACLQNSLSCDQGHFLINCR